MFIDGLIERRGHDLDESLRTIAGTAQPTAICPLADLIDTLITEATETTQTTTTPSRSDCASP